MKRQIKYRGYNLKNKKWLYGYYLVNRGKHYIVQDEVVDPFSKPSDFEVDSESVGHRVGGIDGTDLYEGDIVEMVYKHDGLLFFKGHIVWDTIYCEYRVKKPHGTDMMISLMEGLFLYKVIGNEYEEKLKISNP